MQTCTSRAAPLVDRLLATVAVTAAAKLLVLYVDGLRAQGEVCPPIWRCRARKAGAEPLDVDRVAQFIVDEVTPPPVQGRGEVRIVRSDLR